jgi:hypothetical protein
MMQPMRATGDGLIRVLVSHGAIPKGRTVVIVIDPSSLRATVWAFA